MPFEQCLQIKEVGELYREGTLADVSTEFDLSRSKARNLVADYVRLVNQPTDQVPMERMLIGIKFYGGQYSMDELLEEVDDSYEEDVQKSIREFVAVTLAEQDQDIDLRSVTIPEDVQYPPSMMAAIPTLRETVVQANKRITQSLTAVMPLLSSMMDDLRENYHPLIERIQEIAAQVREAIEDGISNFESPGNYDSEVVQLNTLAQTTGTRFLDDVLEDLEGEEDHPLDPYQNRLEIGIQDFRDNRFYTPIFAFISVQDGIIHWLCQEDGVSKDYDNRFGDPVFSWDTKRDTLARLNQEWYGVSTTEFLNNLEAFYAHRNAIMHGDPLAHFDENIATISLLFLAMTLDTALNYGGS